MEEGTDGEERMGEEGYIIPKKGYVCLDMALLS